LRLPRICFVPSPVNRREAAERGLFARTRSRQCRAVSAYDGEAFRQKVASITAPRVPANAAVDEIRSTQKSAALLMPFGLVTIEALACVTPVIGRRKGWVPEVVQDWVTGFVMDSVEAVVGAVGRLAQVERSTCRQVFGRCFEAARMAHEHVNA
jgi:glycosyltransferase involved in cell wall biosynthesis